MPPRPPTQARRRHVLKGYCDDFRALCTECPVGTRAKIRVQIDDRRLDVRIVFPRRHRNLAAILASRDLFDQSLLGARFAGGVAGCECCTVAPEHDTGKLAEIHHAHTRQEVRTAVGPGGASAMTGDTARVKNAPADVRGLVDLAVDHSVGRRSLGRRRARRVVAATGHRDELALVVDQRHAVVEEDALDLGAVLLDQLVDGFQPLVLTPAHTHRDGIVELDLGVGLERNDDDVRVLCVLAEVAGDRAPREGDVDLAIDQVFLDDLAGILFRITGHALIRHRLVEELVSQQPIDSRRLGEHAEPQLLQLLGRQTRADPQAT